jgi:plasmid replication initiation protein
VSEFVAKPNFYVEGKEIVISKSNALIEGAYELSPSEHDLLTLAINKLHSQRTGGKQVFITAKEFATANGINENYAYEVLKDTAQRLYDRKLSCTLYQDELKEISGEEDIYSVVRPKGNNKPIKLNFRWLQAVAYQEKSGFIHLMFSDPMAYLIGKTGEAYTKYDYAKTIDLNGFHTKRLYELVNKWKGAKPTNGNKYPQIIMALEEWKEFFGCADKYEKTAEFKRWVLLPSIKQINEQKDFTLTLEQEKVGRIITHFVISIKDHQKSKKKEFKDPFKDAVKVDTFTGTTDKDKIKPSAWQAKGLSDGQINKLKVFGKEFCDANSDKMPENFKGSYNDLIDYWALMLQNPNHVGQFKKTQELLSR